MKKIYYLLIIALPMVLAAMPDGGKKKEAPKSPLSLQSIPDSLYQNTGSSNVLDDKLYLQLAKEGWSNEEIVRLTDDYLTERRNQARGTLGDRLYAKQWKPYFGNMLTRDTMYHFVDTTYDETVQNRVRSTFSAADASYERTFYTPTDRMNKKRNTGHFRHVPVLPSGGRIHWIQVHPTDPNKLMVVPDGDAIWRTDNMGKNWKCITDRIPNRYHRAQSNGYAIPVDPDNWDHVFAFMSNGEPVYETLDGGDTWRQIPGASHKGFKRGHAFRDAEGTLKFIGAKPHENWRDSKLYVSQDTCKTWQEVIVPEEMKDIHPTSGLKGFWFQETAFHPTDRNTIFIPTSRSILRFTDGAKLNSEKKFNIEKMKFKVYAADGVTLRSDTTVFPFPATSPMYLNIDPSNSNNMWAALGRLGPETALFHSQDGGATWYTLRDHHAGIGSGDVFGKEPPWVWLGGFGVNYTDPRWIYGCTMDSSISSDGGQNFSRYSWTNRMRGFYPDGNLYTVSCSRHNADNHVIASHKSGRVFRGSDGGMLMKDKAISNHDWINISGDMGQILFYTAKVNEFGDQLITGNTQDIDQQTYRYGRWGQYRGYEGSDAFINPLSGECYFSGGGGGELENQSLGSWDNGWTKADVCTGNWFLRRQNANNDSKFFIIKDFGRSSIKIESQGERHTADFALSRDTENATLYIVNEGGKVYRSYDQGSSFEEIKTNIAGVNHIATNPNNSNEFYLTSNNTGVHKTTDGGRTWSSITTNLPAKIAVNSLHYHEGSGDLYLVSSNNGIFLKTANSTEWELWMKGYNPAAFGDAQINYTTQEMMLYDYGRGVWIADLEHPSDRFFKEGFKLKQLSHVNGARTFGIDTRWSIPLYYYYQWSVNGTPFDAPYQYLTSTALKAGDKVQLKITLRESPDVSTVSAEYTVPQDSSEVKPTDKGNMLSSNGKGRIDLGYVDLFFKDFTIDFWMNARSGGVVLANRPMNDKDAKGWYLQVEKGELLFKYTPANQFLKPFNETDNGQHSTLNAGKFSLNQWNHIAITEGRNDTIHLYVNGVKKVSQKRILPEHSLNNSVFLSLFADGYERNPIDASVDQLRIWNRALPAKEIRKALFTNPTVEGTTLLYHNDFNAESLDQQFETFSGKGMKVRTRAEVVFNPMPMPIGAKWVGYGQVSTEQNLLKDQEVKLASVKSKGTDYTPNIAVYGYENFSSENSNLNSEYYTFSPIGFAVRLFDQPTTQTIKDTIDLKLFIPNATNYQQARLYVCDQDQLNKHWVHGGDLTYDPIDQSLSVQNISASTLDKKCLAIVALKPAIELTINNIGGKGELGIYEDGEKKYPISAKLIKDLQEPISEYRLTSNQGFVKSTTPLYFTQGEAKAFLSINTDSLGQFNETKQVTITGQDNKMIPYTFSLVNRVSPQSSGNSLLFNGGGAIIGMQSDYSSLHLSNTMTYMGWVRFDDEAMLQNVVPFLFFRGGGSSNGLHLDNGELRCHWNEENWSWGASTGLKITSSDLGKWFHIALVATPNSMTYYLNGQKYVLTRSVSKTRILSPLMLGKNIEGDNNFKGAFDQVSLWNRSLTEEEVFAAMHHRTLLNEEGLVTYLNMDIQDKEGRLSEAKNNLLISTSGNYTANYRSPIPYQSVRQEKLSAGQVGTTVGLTLPTSFKGAYYITTFEQFPYNYASQRSSLEQPLIRGYWTVAYNQKQTMTAAEEIRIRFTHPAIFAGDSISLGIRHLGSEEPFVQQKMRQVTENGTVEFTLTANQLLNASQLMLFVKSETEHPTKVAIETAETRIVLKDIDEGVYIDVKRLGGNSNNNVLLSVTESYATLDRDTVNFTESSISRHIIRIDRTKLKPLEINPITIHCSGAEAEAVTLELSLEPKARLSLKNGQTDTYFVADGPNVNLEIEAELLQGIFTDKVQLNTTAEVESAYAMGAGNLLLNKEVKIDGLSYHESLQGKHNAGWNLIGNPYLTNINLTKKENVTAKNATRFLYQYNPETLNYQTVDMTFFDATQQIIPFQPYFVQAMSTEAVIEVHPLAKEKELNKKSIDYLVVSEVEEVKMALHAAERKVDETLIRFESTSSEQFVVNEDASKLAGIDSRANQLYTLAERMPTSILVTPPTTKRIPIELVIGELGAFSFHAEKLNIKEGDEITLIDQLEGAEWKVETGTSYDFTVAKLGKQSERFVLEVKRSTTSLESTTGCQVTVKERICHINGLSIPAEIRIFDLQGRLVIAATATNTHWQAPLQEGFYMVRIRENGKEYVSKISVR